MESSSEEAFTSDDEYYDYYEVEEGEAEEQQQEEQEEFISEGLADSHYTLMSRTKEYEDKVSFYVGPGPGKDGGEAGGGSVGGVKTAAAAKARTPLSGQSQARQSSAALGRTRNSAATASRVGKGMTTRGSIREASNTGPRAAGGLQKGAMKDATSSRTGRTSTTASAVRTPRQPLTGPQAKETGTVSFRTRSKASQSMANFSRDSTRSMANVRAGAPGQRLAGRKPLHEPRVAPTQKQIGKNGSGLASASRTSVMSSSRQMGARTSGKDLGTLREGKEPMVKSGKDIRSPPTKGVSAIKKGESLKKAAATASTTGTGSSKIPAPLSELSPVSSSESDQKRFSESSDGDSSPVKLYQPKPTLKELAEGKATGFQRRHNSISGRNRKNLSDKCKQENTFSFAKTPETIMTMFQERETEFRDQFFIAVGGSTTTSKKQTRTTGSRNKTGSVKIPPNIQEVVDKENTVPSIDSIQIVPNQQQKLAASNKQPPGLNHLDNLLTLMDQFSQLRSENHNLKRRCSYLEDVKSLLNLQNRMMSASRVKQMNKTESFISKAQSKVKHYLASPTVGAAHTYSRVNSEGATVGGPLSPELILKGNLQRSNSVGSIEELDLAATLVEPTMRSITSEKPGSVVSGKAAKSIGKKVNKSRFVKWTKMKKVFGKPDSPGKIEGGAISAEEIIRVNKEKGMKPRPPMLPPSKSFDHGELASGSISDDNNTYPGASRLSVDQTRTTPPSPGSCHSEPGVTSFPATTPMQQEYDEIGTPIPKKAEHDTFDDIVNTAPLSTSAPTSRGHSMDISSLTSSPSSPKSHYVDMGGTHSVRTTVRTISPKPGRSSGAYTNQSYEHHETMDHPSGSTSDTEEDKAVARLFEEIGAPLVRRKSSPTLSLRGSAGDVSSRLSTPIEIRRSSSFKMRSNNKRNSDVEDRSIRNKAYITENLLSPEDAKRAQLQMRSRGSDGGDVHKKAKAAWFKVKDIIHTQRDSIKRRRRRSISGGEELFSDMSSHDGSSWDDRMSLATDELEEIMKELQRKNFNLEDISDSESKPITMPYPIATTSSATEDGSVSIDATASASFSPPAASSGSPPPPAGMLEGPAMAGTASSATNLYRSQTVKPLTSSPKPMRKRACSVKNPYEFMPPLIPSKRGDSVLLSPQGTPIQLQALMGSINEDFHKKMAEWEDKKKKGDDQKNVNFTDDFIKKMEEWERMKGLESTSPPKSKEAQLGQRVQKTQSPPPSVPPVPELPNLEGGETIEHLSETFSKTVQEWERIKEKRARAEGAEGCGLTSTGSGKEKGGRSRRQERSKSRDRDRHPRDKSRQRYEREIQKREQKLEKERQKLDRMKQKLDHPHEWHNEGVQSDFLSKFYDWDVLKNFNSALSVGEQHHSRSRSEKRQRESVAGTARERVMSDSLLDQLVTHDLERGVSTSRSSTSFEHSGEVIGGSGPSSPTRQPTSPLVDDSTSIDLGLTMETIAMLEEANEKLSLELSEREDELESMQYRSQELTHKLHHLSEQRNSDIEHYKKELWASSKIGRYTIESQNLTSSLKQLKQKLNELQEFGEKVMQERRVADLSEVTEKEQISRREEELLAQIESIQRELDCKTYVQGTEVFDTLYRYIHNVHKQVDSLQCGVLERDTMINSLHHHVMIQEVYNHLLNSELQRREATLNFLRQHRKAGILRRWNTFHGQDITIREDGSIELKKGKDEESYCIVPPPGVKKLSQETVDLVKDRSEGMALHFDWLDSMKEQIKEVQESQKADVDVQACTDNAEVNTQTLLSLLDPRVPPWRLKWDGTELQVCDHGVQHRVTTADAAVFIEDLDIYEKKQKSKRKLGSKKSGKVDQTVPKRGTVSKRMEIFDPRIKEKTPERITKKLGSKSDDSIGADEEEESQNKTVIGKKVLDYEQCEHSQEMDDNLDKEMSATHLEVVRLDFESVEPVSVLYKECDREVSTDEPQSQIQHMSVSGCSDIEISYTLTLLDDTDDENAKDLKNEKDIRGRNRKHSSDEDLVFVEGSFSDISPTEIEFKMQDVYSLDENVFQREVDDVMTMSTSSDIVLQSRPPLSPIIRSKYARKQQQGKQSNVTIPSRRVLRQLNRQSSTEKSLEDDEMRSRTCSDSSMLHSKYGSDDIEETTAAKFSVNMEKYLFKTRGSTDGILVVQEKVIRSFEAQPFSRECLFRKSPSPALRKPAVSAIRTLKTAEELFRETERNFRGRSLSVPKEGMIGILPFINHNKVAGDTSPHSVPSSSPNITRKSQTALLKAVTKRLSLPMGQLTPLDHTPGVSDVVLKEQSPLVRQDTKDRKALVLEPLILDKNRQLRPHSIISCTSEASQSNANESIWQKIVKPKASTLQRRPSAKRAHVGRRFKLFNRHAGHSYKHGGTISKLCMHTVTLDTSSDSSSTQHLPTEDIGKIRPTTSKAAYATAPSVMVSPLSEKKPKKKPFLDAKWLSRSKRFFKGSNLRGDRGKSDSEAYSEADDNSNLNNSQCDSSYHGNNRYSLQDNFTYNLDTSDPLQHHQQGSQSPSRSNNTSSPVSIRVPEGHHTPKTDIAIANISMENSNNSLMSSTSFSQSGEHIEINMEDFNVLDVDSNSSCSNNQNAIGSESVVGNSNVAPSRTQSEGNVHRIPIIQIHNDI